MRIESKKIASSPDWTPTATLAATTSSAGDVLGSTNGQGIFLRDITGDGTDDLIVLAPGAVSSCVRASR